MSEILEIPAGQSKTLHATGKYLVLRSTTGAIEISAAGGDGFEMLVGENLEIFDVNKFNIKNITNETVTAVFANPDFKVRSSGGSSVTVVNDIVVKRIEEAIQVTADATVENGSMRLIRANQYIPIADTVIPANDYVQIALTRVVKNRRVTLQSVGVNGVTKLRFGKDATINGGGKGLLLQGDISNPASIIIENESSIFVYNESDNAAIITGVEEYQQ